MAREEKRCIDCKYWSEYETADEGYRACNRSSVGEVSIADDKKDSLLFLSDDIVITGENFYCKHWEEK